MTLSELLPSIGELSLDEKWQLMDGLWHELAEPDNTTEISEEIHSVLEARYQNYLLNPSSGSSVEEVCRKMRNKALR